VHRINEQVTPVPPRSRSVAVAMAPMTLQTNGAVSLTTDPRVVVVGDEREAESREAESSVFADLCVLHEVERGMLLARHGVTDLDHRAHPDHHGPQLKPLRCLGSEERASPARAPSRQRDDAFRRC